MKKNTFQYIVWIFLSIILIAIPNVLPNDYYRGIVNIALIYSIVAMGINFIYGYTGYISFAQASFFGIGAYVSALLTVDAHLSFWIAFPAAGLIAMLFGVILGIPTLKLSTHYLSIVTIGFGIIIQMVLLNWEAVTHGASGVTNIPDINLGILKIDNSIKYYYFLLVITILVIIFEKHVVNSKLGRSFKAVREDEIAAGSCGINLTFTKVLAFALSALLGGIGGSLYAHMSTYISPDTFSFDQSLVFFSMNLIGGAGTIIGPLVGAVIYTIVPELMRSFKEVYMALVGIGIVFLVLFLPQGIAPNFMKGGKVANWVKSIQSRF